jgi:hypothetical protein
MAYYVKRAPSRFSDKHPHLHEQRRSVEYGGRCRPCAHNFLAENSSSRFRTLLAVRGRCLSRRPKVRPHGGRDVQGRRPGMLRRFHREQYDNHAAHLHHHCCRHAQRCGTEDDLGWHLDGGNSCFRRGAGHVRGRSIPSSSGATTRPIIGWPSTVATNGNLLLICGFWRCRPSQQHGDRRSHLGSGVQGCCSLARWQLRGVAERCC